MIAERLLQVLEDVRGVSGSFLMSRSGELLLHAMPGYYDVAALRLSAQRVGRLLACGGANGLDAEEAVFEFDTGKLFIREFVRGYLCVLCEPSLNMRSLRLTARLVARGMPADLDQYANRQAPLSEPFGR